MAPVVHPVILSGGAGTRLWPMSRTMQPKQLLALVTERTMFQEAIARVSGAGFAKPIVICNDDHRFMIAEQLRSQGVKPDVIVLEPVGRNTAPAITVAALHLAASDPTALMLVLPSDHVIRDLDAFRDAVAGAAVAADQGALVTFGITPTRPETGYGYIRRGAPVADAPGCYRVERFVEKPDAEDAERFVSDGAYVWNSGMFLLPAAVYLDEVARLEPGMLAQCREAVATAAVDLDFLRLNRTAFEAIAGSSVDYAVMERTDKAAVLPVAIGWSDVGSWSALWEIAEKDDAGNVLSGDVVARDTRDCYIRADGHLIATVGLSDLVVVATDDVILIVPRDRAQEVRQVVQVLAEAGRSEPFVHTRVFRPWGWFQSIDAGPRYQVKQLLVNPGERLSRQMHYHRAEHWIVVSGTAKVMRGDTSFFLTEDQSTYIPHNTPHCLENPGKLPLKLIEVQSGPYLGEDDIVRFDDTYGRTDPVDGR
jgi:mannose-1-phosphate guanylyltransferase/mannose-6-phosphate isomerase